MTALEKHTEMCEHEEGKNEIEILCTARIIEKKK